MIDTPKDYEEDELIDVKLPRKQFLLLKDFLEKEAATNWLESSFRRHWVWIIGPAALTLMYLFNEIKHLFNGGS